MASTLKTNAIEPEGATTNLVIGESGQNTVISNNDLRANVLQDAGGNAVFTSDGSGNLSGINSGLGSAMVLLSTQTASSHASVEFTSGITSTYGEYIFKFYNCNPEVDDRYFLVEFSDDGGSSFAETKTSTYFAAQHAEADGAEELSFNDANDLAQSTDPQRIVHGTGGGSDEGCAGEMHLFNPAGTTYVKHYLIETTRNAAMARHAFIGGYCNTTSAINGVRFTFSEGDFDGKIKMYGVK